MTITVTVNAFLLYSVLDNPTFIYLCGHTGGTLKFFGPPSLQILSTERLINTSNVN